MDRIRENDKVFNSGDLVLSTWDGPKYCIVCVLVTTCYNMFTMLSFFLWVASVSYKCYQTIVNNLFIGAFLKSD